MKTKSLWSKRLVMILIVVGWAAFSWLHQPSASQIISNGLTVSVLDIGQGDSILVDTPNNHHILVDGGPDNTVLARLGQYLAFRDHTIDLLIISHNHSDHIAGLLPVLKRYDVKQIWLSGALHTTNDYLNLLTEIRDEHIPTKDVKAGDKETIDSVGLAVVFPIDSMVGATPTDQHDATVVVKATYKAQSILLTGDLNEGHEQAIIDSGADISADVLKIPHHGSCTGLSTDFLNTVKPTFAIISLSEGNTYGFPCKQTIDRLIQAGVSIFRTDRNGTVTASTDGVKWTVTSER